MVRIRGLRVIREFDPWSSPLCTCPHKFTLNPYTGCGHHCIYCYARSYIRNFDNPRPKAGLIVNVLRDLSKLPKNALISMSESSDPYTPPERELVLTRRVLKLIAEAGFKLLIVTKSDLVVRDADILERYGKSAVAITITTLNDDKAKLIEPNAPPPSSRLRAVQELSRRGIPVTVRVDPIIPGINDSEEELRELIKEVADTGAVQITTSTYKARADSLSKLIRTFPKAAELLKKLYLMEGERHSGYIYMPKQLRLRYLLLVKKIAESHGIAFSTCREGFRFLNTPGIYCDGSTYAFMRT
ncbi:MAG: radical SAM protein [Desulfurococcales archaeon]|nr:radical SAM protein [Desulfurococcales archaeon]